jgi:hexosaminidase|eukprot:COSAG06_NODE_414_length_16033_cov_67.366717_20_plen_67_part_00
MADTGRRFWPVPTIQSILDAMASVKMNVLHLHLSDNCRFAVELEKFPLLTARNKGFMAGTYPLRHI